MNKSSFLQDLLLLKTAALFHDPPDKAWCLRRREDHEKWAKELAETALAGTLLEKAVDMISDKRVKDADILAASIDRFLLGKLIGKKEGALPERSIKLKNPLNPEIEVNLEVEIQKDRVKDVMRKINNVLRKAENSESAYLALYGLYELIWINEGLTSGPADTRIPVHSVFDHLYATAAALNWTYKGNGLLLSIDVAGVQDFIAQSRKLRDLWASSYIISALLWSTIVNFIKTYGPDVVLAPTCRFNPFFYCYLANKVPSIGAFVNEIIKSIEGMEELAGEEEWSFPRFAVVPGSAMLILPPLEGFNGNPEKLIEESFREKWRSFCDGIRKLPELMPLIKELEKEKEYGFINTPPFSIRVSSSNVDVFKEDAPYLKAYGEVTEKNRRKKLLKVDPACELTLTRITKEIFVGKRGPLAGSKRGFDYCTMCGKLPAIVSATRQVEGIGQAILGEGERLCPYCLMKRIFSFKPGPVLSEILEYRGGVDLGSYPSLADVATFDLKDSFVKALPLLNELWKDPSTKELIKKLIGRILGEESRKGRVLSWKYQRRKFKVISESNADPDLKEILLRLLCAESEDIIVEKERRAHWNELRSILSKRGIITPPINTYYSLIRADGDDMGKILGGNIRDIGINVENYILSLFEGKSKEIISKILKNDITSAKEERLDEENVDEVKKAIDKIKSERRIPVSISYHVSISRALMIAALNDVKFVDENNGVVIYAGGDDLLAVAPVSSAIKIIHESRLTYGGLEKDHGRKAERFYKFNKYYIPSMGNAGRSYSLYIAHYRYPLYEVIRDSALKLEEVAKESTWVDGGSRRKDSLVVTYSPRGSPVSSVLPFSIEKSDGDTSGELVFTNLTSFLENIIEGISSGKISTALFYEASGGDLMKTATRMWETMKRRGRMDPGLFEALVKYLVGRHLSVEKEEKTSFLDSIVRPILENRSLVRKSLDGETPLFIEIFRTCRLFYSGLRGD